jgi:hypothetical protein
MAAAVCMLASAAAFAEEETKQPVEVSGKIFFDYSYIMTGKEKVKSTKTAGKDSLNLTRAYLTFDKKIDDAWSAKVTLDGGTLDQTATGQDSTKATVTSTTKSSAAFVKNAYGQYKNSFGPADLKIQAGLVGTPVIDLLDGLIGSRWIYQNYLDKASDVTGSSFDVSSADTGVKAEVKLMKMVSLTGMYANGDGYKTNTTDQDAATKSYYGTLNINPIEALNLFGFYHKHNVSVSGVTGAAADKKNNQVAYYGAGVAWKDKNFKVGASYTIEDGNKKNIKEEGTVLELWANASLNEFIGMPVLVIGRYAQGTYEDKNSNTAKKNENEGSAIWGGVGYQFSKNVQVAAMYKMDALTKKTGGVKASDAENNTFFVKTEVVF